MAQVTFYLSPIQSASDFLNRLATITHSNAERNRCTLGVTINFFVTFP